MNSVINHPSVKGGAQVKGVCDISETILNRKNVLLENDHGGFLVLERMPGIYECHTQFLPSGRGANVRECAKWAFRYMFTKTDCMKVITTASTPAAIKLSREFFREKGETGGVKYFSLTYEDWVETDDEVKREGELFHELVKDNTNHGKDESHDIHVGSASLMFKAGNINKAQTLYNQWAIMSGYEPVSIESANPLILRIKNMIISYEDGDILCQ
jgi:hypothetical protein